jgi:hypothetical protein
VGILRQRITKVKLEKVSTGKSKDR